MFWMSNWVRIFSDDKDGKQKRVGYEINFNHFFTSIPLLRKLYDTNEELKQIEWETAVLFEGDSSSV
ncbi:hypothetical protein MF1_09250 [Bartonella quintana]|nr:hypothetical protein MF1_09250 [Bartonella quintana]